MNIRLCFGFTVIPALLVVTAAQTISTPQPEGIPVGVIVHRDDPALVVSLVRHVIERASLTK